MPEPFASAASVTVRPPSTIVRDTSLVRVSVVRIASAAGSGAPVSCATNAGAAAINFCTGNRTPIMPVEAVRIWSGVAPSAVATAVRIATTSASPAAPVSAFALPLLTTTARIAALGTRVRASTIGAAAAAFCENLPAATHGSSLAINAMSLRTGFNPQWTPA